MSIELEYTGIANGVSEIMMFHFFQRYSGILAGVFYGLIVRLVLGFTGEFRLGSLFSLSFVWIVPVVVGLLPMILAREAQRRSWRYRVAGPALAIGLFFTTALVFRIEDLLCILVISLPFIAGAIIASALGVFIYRKVRDYRAQRKGRLYSLMALPLLLAAVEDRLPVPSDEWTVRTAIVVHAPASEVWEHIVRVEPIAEKEYAKGVLNYAGIPRPLYAELDSDTLGGIRIGHFEGGLRFIEKVSTWERNRKFAIDIAVDSTSIRRTVFDQHILKGRSFAFVRAGYEIHPLDNGTVELVLTSTYRLHTTINAYGAWWGNIMLADFQNRLLDVIKQRCER